MCYLTVAHNNGIIDSIGTPERNCGKADISVKYFSGVI